MAGARKKNNETEDGSIRRIGFRHALVLPPRQAVVVDMSSVGTELERVERSFEALTNKLSLLATRRAELRAQMAEFEALKIDRDDDDPRVPLAAPKTAAEAQAERAKRTQEEAERLAREPTAVPAPEVGTR